MSTTFKLTTKSVNSKVLFKEINEFIEDGIQTAGVLWSSETHRESFVDIVEEYLDVEFVETGKISQVKVVCDSRNNKMSVMESGVYNFDVYFRQNHCLNVTELHYTIKEDDSKTIDDLFDFVF